MQIGLTKMTLERITLEHMTTVHHGFGVALPVFLL